MLFSKKAERWYQYGYMIISYVWYLQMVRAERPDISIGFFLAHSFLNENNLEPYLA